MLHVLAKKYKTQVGVLEKRVETIEMHKTAAEQRIEKEIEKNKTLEEALNKCT